MTPPIGLITILTPCRNERENVRALHERIAAVMAAYASERERGSEGEGEGHRGRESERGSESDPALPRLRRTGSEGESEGDTLSLVALTGHGVKASMPKGRASAASTG